MYSNNKILILSKAFALRIIKLYNYLKDERGEQVMSRQILRSGTSIGANARESLNAASKLDFINKLSIALKEADETEYWLELLHESNYITDSEFLSIDQDCKTLIGILVKSVKNTKQNLGIQVY